MTLTRYTVEGHETLFDTMAEAMEFDPDAKVTEHEFEWADSSVVHDPNEEAATDG